MKLNINSKIKKILVVIISFLILFSIGLFFVGKYYFNDIVNYALRNGLKYNIAIKEIKIEGFGLIKAYDAKLYDKRNKLVIDSPSIILKYSFKDILQKRYVSEMILENPTVNLEITNVKDTNIMSALNLDKKKKSNTKSPIREIKIENGVLNYLESSYERKINISANKVNGFIDMNNMFKLDLKGNRINSSEEKLSFSMEQLKNKKYAFDVKLRNFRISDEMAQYAYDDKGTITYNAGLLDLDFKFGGASKEVLAKLKNGNIKYNYLVDNLTNVNGVIKLKGDKLKIDLDAYLLKNPIKFNLEKNKNQLGVFFDGENIPIKDVLKNLPQKGFYKELKGNFSKVHGQIINKDITKNKANLEILLESPQINYLNININNILAKLEMDTDTKKLFLKDINFTLKKEDDLDYKLNMDFNLKGTFENNLLKANYKIKNIDSFIKNKNFEGNLLLDGVKENILINNTGPKNKFEIYYDFKSELIKLDGQFSEPLEFGNDKIKNNQLKGKLNIEYNLKRKKLLKINGKINISNDFYFSNLNIDIENNNDLILFKNVNGTTGNSYLEGSGQVNLTSLEYEFKSEKTIVDSKDFKALGKYPPFILDVSFDLKGIKKDFELNYSANLESLKTVATVNDTHFYGKIQNKDNNLTGTAEGYIKKLLYNDLSFGDLYINLSLDKDKIIVEDIKNANLQIYGKYYLNTNSLDLNFSLFDYDLEKLQMNKYNLQGYLGKVDGKILGKLENPEVKVQVSDSYINYNNTENAPIYGSFRLKDKIIELDDFYFKENRVQGTVYLQEKKLNLNMNLMEANLNKYYKDSNVKYRVIGIVNLWGNFDDVRAVAQVNLDSIYYRGEKIPDLAVKLSYKDGSLSKITETGRLNLTEMKILGENGFNIIEADGFLDIKSREFELKLGNKNLPIKNIEYLVNDYKLSGNLDLDLEAKGRIGGNISYKVDLESSDLNYNNILIDKIYAKIKGTEKKVDVEYLKMKYGKDTLNADGIFNIEDGKYDFSVKAKDFDLGILNIVLRDKIRDVGGKVDLDLIIKNEMSKGSIMLKNGTFSDVAKDIIFSDLNGEVSLNLEEIKIKSFTGRLNNGTINMDGYLKIPKFSEDLMVNTFDKLDDYALNIKLDKVDYRYAKTILLNLNTDLTYTKNMLTGDIFINSGDVFKLPEAKKDEKTEPLKIGFNAKLNIEIGEKGVYFRADNIPLVDDIELKIEGGGILGIENDKINFIGRLTSENGALTFSNNIFEVQSGIIVFDGINEYFPDINPSIAIKATTSVGTEDIYVTLSGYYKEMTLDLQSSSDLSTQDITSLLLFKGTGTNTSVNSVVKDVLDKQFSDEIFNPLSKELEKLLNISKVKISSKILKIDDETLSLSPNVLSGTTVEFSNPLYKEKINWNGKITFGDDETTKLSKYDVWLDYQLNKNISLNLGLEGNEEYTDKYNLHFGIDFKYQLDSIF